MTSPGRYILILPSPILGPPLVKPMYVIENVKNCAGFVFLTMTLSKPYPIDLTRGKVLFDPSMTFEKVLSRKFSYNRR